MHTGRLLLLLLLLEALQVGRGVERVALGRGGRGPRVGELRTVGIGHVVEVQAAAEALLMVDGHGHLRGTLLVNRARGRGGAEKVHKQNPRSRRRRISGQERGSDAGSRGRTEAPLQ